MNKIIQGLIYKSKNRRGKKFDCCSPAVQFCKGMTVLDCWIVDESGNLSPETDISPVPVKIENMGDVVGILGYDPEDKIPW